MGLANEMEASPEMKALWRKQEENRINGARHRLLAAILSAAENTELCNTLSEDEILNNIREDIRMTVREWLNTLAPHVSPE